MHILVTQAPSDIRTLARQALKGRWGQASLVCLLALILEVAFEVPVLLFELENPFFETAATVYTIVMTGAVEFGLAAYFVHLFRSENPHVGELFEGFHYLLKCVLLSLVCEIITLLGTMLFVIPGIIAAYRHSMAFHILDDDPTKGVLQCVRESGEMMQGNKLALLMTDLSFFGWFFLVNIPAAILGTVYVQTHGMMSPQELLLQEFSDPKFQLLSLLCSVVAVPVNAYHHTARACFYDFLNGRLVPANQQNAYFATDDGRIIQTRVADPLYEDEETIVDLDEDGYPEDASEDRPYPDQDDAQDL